MLSYRGRRSGRAFRVPLRYAETANGVVALAVHPDGKLWWRSFAEPADATLTLRGARMPVVGSLADGSVRDRALAAYVGRYPRSATFARDAAVVVFAPTRESA